MSELLFIFYTVSRRAATSETLSLIEWSGTILNILLYAASAGIRTKFKKMLWDKINNDKNRGYDSFNLPLTKTPHRV